MYLGEKNIYEEIRFLVIDDMSSMRHLISSLLKKKGAKHITLARDGQEGLMKIASGAFTFIISDWIMPQISGLELLRLVRSMEDLKDLPFLMVSAEAQRERVIEAIELNVDGYIVKPFMADTLYNKIESIWRKSSFVPPMEVSEVQTNVNNVLFGTSPVSLFSTNR